MFVTSLHAMLVTGALPVLATGMLAERARRRHAERLLCHLRSRARDLFCAAADIVFELDQSKVCA